MSKYILTDVDDTILKWYEPFHEYMLKKGYEEKPNMSFYDWVTNNHDLINDDVRNFNEGPAFENLEPFDDAYEIVTALAKAGYKFVAISACENDDLTIKRRKNNLEKYWPGVFEDVFCVGLFGSKLEKLSQYEPTWWIEDNYGHAKVGKDLGHTSLVIDRPHNRHRKIPGLMIVDSWHTIKKMIHHRD